MKSIVLIQSNFYAQGLIQVMSHSKLEHQILDIFPNVDSYLDSDIAKYRSDAIVIVAEALLKEVSKYKTTVLYKNQRVIIIAESNSNTDIAFSSYVSEGAKAFLRVDVSTEVLCKAIETADENSVLLYGAVKPSVLKMQLDAFNKMQASNNSNQAFPKELTRRECDVIKLLALGMDNRDISEKLCISEKTTKNHVSNILAKLELKHRTQVVILAARKRWVDLDNMEYKIS